MSCPSSSVSHDDFLMTDSALKASYICAIHAAATSGCMITGTRAVGTGRAPMRAMARRAPSVATSSALGSSASQRFDTP